MKTQQEAPASPFPRVAGIVGSSSASSPALSGHTQQVFLVFSCLAGGSLLCTKSVPPNGLQLFCDYLFFLDFSLESDSQTFPCYCSLVRVKKKKLDFLDSVNGRRFWIIFRSDYFRIDLELPKGWFSLSMGLHRVGHNWSVLAAAAAAAATFKDLFFHLLIRHDFNSDIAGRFARELLI